MALSELVVVFSTLIRGVELIGDAAAGLFELAFSALGLPLPGWVVRAGMLASMFLVVWRLGSVIPRLVLAGLAFLFVATLLGLIPSQTFLI